MHVMLADEVATGFFTIAVIFGEIVTSLLALVALSSAAQGDRSLAVILIAPAAILGVSITLYFGYAYVKFMLYGPSYPLFEFILPWIVMAGLPLVMSLLVFLKIWRN